MNFKFTRSKINLLVMMTLLVMILAGCANPNNTDGIMFQFIVSPISNLIEWLADYFNGSYGMAIIAITVLVRIVILPLTINQLHASTKQSVRMQKIQPYLKEIQERQKNAATQEEKMAAAMEQQQFFKENNINILGSMGCLPLLLQLPIISGLYTAILVSESINNGIFLGIPLGETSILLGVLTLAAYALQSWVSLQGMTDEQKAQMRTSMMAMPVMMAFIVFTTPAGLTLYFLAGALLSIGQSLYTNLVFRPKIVAQVEQEMAENPIKKPTAAFNANSGGPGAKDVTNSVPTNEAKNDAKKIRNIGKQNRDN